MLASVPNLGQNGGPLYTLNNNTKAGNFLAIYGILAWRNGTTKLMAATVASGLSGGPPTTAITQPIIQGRAALDGYVGLGSNFSVATQSAGVLFIGDGIRWLTMGDLPLFVIAPGNQLIVQNANISGHTTSFEAGAVTFLWGYYSTSQPPRLGKFISTLISGGAPASG
jgi:hypothetical protein